MVLQMPAGVGPVSWMFSVKAPYFWCESSGPFMKLATT
jgi:hypothetical protein